MTMSTPYLLDNHQPASGDRFRALSACFDRVTFEALASIGVGPGWRCWEVGAGGPSVPIWLSAQVGPTGLVVASDVDTSWLSPPPPGVDVRVHDVATDDPPEDRFDLVHARLVLTHVPQRDRALERMAAALQPGGWLVIEDFDVAAGAAACPDARNEDERRANKIRAGFVALLAERGVDLRFGRSLRARLGDLGFVEVAAEARIPVADPAMRALERANTSQVAEALVAAGHASPAEVAAHLRAIEHLAIAAPPMFVARGRRRHPGEEVQASVAVDAPTVDGAGRQMVAVRPDGDVLQREWLDGFVGLSDRTSGARGLSMQLVVVPPGGAAPAHWHPLHETGVYVISGEVEVRSGVELEDHLICRSGDFVFTPPGLRHTARNMSATRPAYLIAARNDPSEHESTIIDVDTPRPPHDEAVETR